MVPHFILASASPARYRLLQTVGIQPQVIVSNFDESSVTESDPVELVRTLAQLKAETVINQTENSLILGCDSVLKIANQIHGKPSSVEEAKSRWQLMRNNVGKIYTGHAIIDQTTGVTIASCRMTRVYFANITDAEIDAYISSGEPLKCAGGFALEGKGGAFIEEIDGCHSNVIGLSLPLLREMLTSLGYHITDFWC